MDIVHDQMATGRKIRILTVVDAFLRFSPVTDARLFCWGKDVVQTLERICRKAGYPETIRADKGSEFIWRNLNLWAYQKGVILDFCFPRKKTEAWHKDDNEMLSHGAIDNKVMMCTLRLIGTVAMMSSTQENSSQSWSSFESASMLLNT